MATLVALPAGFIWLQNFSASGRTEIEPDTFAIPLMLVLVILVLSVSYQVIKGAL